jgi:hypothetical protein
MRAKTINILWGLLLILGGGLFLAQNLGLLTNLEPFVWVVIFGGVSLLFFSNYALNGLHQWGWLFPAFISAGIALTIFLAESGVGGGVVAAPILLGVGLPFLAAYAVDRRRNWWALIPAWVLAVVVLIILLAERAPGEMIAALVMFSIALPFVIVFLLDPNRRWALIPSFVLIAVGLIPLLTMIGSGEAIGALVMFLIAIPFFGMYFLSRDSWWALLPAGITGSLGLAILLMALQIRGLDQTALFTGVLFLGFGVTFAVLWTRRNNHPTGWSIYPAGGFAILGLLAFVLGSQSDLVWPVAIILAGLLLLVNSLRTRKSSE